MRKQPRMAASMALILAVMTSSCKYAPHIFPDSNQVIHEAVTPAATPAPANKEKRDVTAPKRAVTADERRLAKASNDFGLDLLAQLGRQAPGNLFFSPYSISTALAMTYAGARGETAAQMARVLHWAADENVHPQLKSLRENCESANREGNALTIANGLWIDKKLQFEKPYLRTIELDYRPAWGRVDFDSPKEAQAACAQINAWVAQKTANHITQAITPGALTPFTRLVLANAVYFKGSWDKPFGESDTAELPFTIQPGRQVKVPLMNQQEKFGYAEDQEVQVLEMSYRGDDLSMVAILPRQADGLGKLKITPARLDGWLEKERWREVKVWFPKLKFETSFKLNDPLKALGMERAFAPAADFSGISRRGDQNLHISKVLHKGVVEVNEKGTEAAAATVMTMEPTSAEVNPPPIPEFKADHPFLFLIRHNRTGCILFIGRVVNPINVVSN